MRHGKKDNHLGRTTAHRTAMLSNMAISLIIKKRIETTVAKAKELKKFVEPLITKSKEDTTHSRRTVFSYLQNKESLKELFDNVSGKIATRPGGYTRIIKTGTRLGDNADTCIIELVDYNMLYTNNEKSEAKSKTRRGRRSGAGGKELDTPVITKVAAEKIEADEVVDTVEDAEVQETNATDVAPVEGTSADAETKE